MNVLQDSLLELIRRASAEIPDDVHKAILGALERERQGTIAASAMKIIEQNIALAKSKSQPICQDTGSIIFYVDCPKGFDQLDFEQAASEAVKLATRKGFLRQNSVDSITGKNDGTNVGPGSPILHFHQHASAEVNVRLVLKGGGCENVGAQYSLPNEKLKANRDLLVWFPRLLGERRRIQASRRISTAGFASILTPDLDSDFFPGFVRSAPMRFLLRGYWRAVQALLRG
jgi:fumarate hydratase class I